MSNLDQQGLFDIRSFSVKYPLFYDHICCIIAWKTEEANKAVLLKHAKDTSNNIDARAKALTQLTRYGLFRNRYGSKPSRYEVNFSD